MGDQQEKPAFVGMRRDEDGALLLELHAEWIDWRMRELADAGAIDALTTAERALFEDALEAQGAYQTALMESAGLLDGCDPAQAGGIAGLRR